MCAHRVICCSLYSIRVTLRQQLCDHYGLQVKCTVLKFVCVFSDHLLLAVVPGECRALWGEPSQVATLG